MAKILLCDDSKSALSLIERKLLSAGHETVGKGRDGHEGLQLYKDTKPDLMLLDITMPNRDGRECLEDIMKFDPAAKVVMVSALKKDALTEECIAMGAKGFVSKAEIVDDKVFQREVLLLIDNLLTNKAA
jgi:two-component system, chemotaxis family, chemotaxis protein CheY